MTHRVKSAIFAVVLLGVTCVIAEVALRVAHYLVSGTSPTTLLPLYRERRFVMSPFLVFGPRIDWQIANTPNPDAAYFNKQALRTKEIVGPKSPSEFRIIAIGGSTTEDVGNEEGLHWPLWVERELHRAGFGQVRVYNTGMAAYSSAHTLIRLAFDVLDYEPDMVLVMDNINDLTVNYHAALAGTPVDAHYLVKFGQKLYTFDLDEDDVIVSRLLQSIRSRLAGTDERTVPADYDISRGLGFFKRNLANTDALVANAGARTVLLTMPACDSEEIYKLVEFYGRRQFSDPLPSFENFNRDFGRYNDGIREIAAARGVTMVDMARLFGSDRKYFADFVHYNAAGSQRFGGIVAAQLAPVIREMTSKRAVADPAVTAKSSN